MSKFQNRILHLIFPDEFKLKLKFRQKCHRVISHITQAFIPTRACSFVKRDENRKVFEKSEVFDWKFSNLCEVCIFYSNHTTWGINFADASLGIRKFSVSNMTEVRRHCHELNPQLLSKFWLYSGISVREALICQPIWLQKERNRDIYLSDRNHNWKKPGNSFVIN